MLFVLKSPPEGYISVYALRHSICYVAGGPGILRQLSTSRKAPAHEKQAAFKRFTGILKKRLQIIIILPNRRSNLPNPE